MTNDSPIVHIHFADRDTFTRAVAIIHAEWPAWARTGAWGRIAYAVSWITRNMDCEVTS